jgi:DNA topoisomerase-1
VGHVRDLPTKELGVDVDEGFQPKYVTIRGKGKVLKELRKKARNAESIYLATDPDREVREPGDGSLAGRLGDAHDVPAQFRTPVFVDDVTTHRGRMIPPRSAATTAKSHWTR